MELELKHLAGYLPYGLKCHCMGLYIDEEVPKPIDVVICGLSNHCVETLAVNEKKTEWFFINDVLPLLRPVSSLTKEIEVNGFLFVPIVELAKLAFFKTEGAELCGNFARLEDGYSFHFSNNTDGVCFSCRKGYDGKRWDYNCFIPNQMGLFQKLYEWHFDIYGLIDNGLAIAIED